MEHEVVRMFCQGCNLEVLPNDFSGKDALRAFMVSGLCEKCQEKVLASGGSPTWHVEVPGYVVSLDGFDKYGEEVYTRMKPGWIPEGLNDKEIAEDEEYFGGDRVVTND